MARKKQRTNWKLNIPFADLQAMAPRILELSRFKSLITAECELQRSSGVWEKKNGTCTARLVYRTELSNSLVLSIGFIPKSATKPDKPLVVNG